MNSYNGWTPHERNKVTGIQEAAYRAKKIARPCFCCACGSVEGVFIHHCEDYTPKFGPHLFSYPMCYPCHMMVHCRFRAPEVWDLYRAKVKQGGRVAEPFLSRDWPRFKAEVLAGFKDLTWISDGVVRTVLEDIK